MSDFNLQEFANDVYYSMKEREYRNLTEDQLSTIEEQRSSGQWNDADFTQALAQANATYANDLTEGHIEGSGVEGRLQSLIQDCATTGNEMLTMAVKNLVRESVDNDIQTQTIHVPTIHTNARFHLQDATESAIGKALQGDFTKLTEFAQREGDGAGFKMAALATLGMMQAHVAMNPPEPKTGLSANLENVARPPSA
jgi:hypothetical protein